MVTINRKDRELPPQLNFELIGFGAKGFGFYHGDLGKLVKEES